MGNLCFKTQRSELTPQQTPQLPKTKTPETTSKQTPPPPQSKIEKPEPTPQQTPPLSKTEKPETSSQQTPPPVSLDKDFNFESFVVTTNIPVWGEHLKAKLDSIWQTIAIENGTIVILSGAHGSSNGMMKRRDESAKVKDAAVFVDEDKRMVKQFEIERAEDFKNLNLKMQVIDVYENEHSDGFPNIVKLSEKVKTIQPTCIVAGWCYSKNVEDFFEMIGLTATMVLQNDLMKVLGPKG